MPFTHWWPSDLTRNTLVYAPSVCVAKTMAPFTGPDTEKAMDPKAPCVQVVDYHRKPGSCPQRDTQLRKPVDDMHDAVPIITTGIYGNGVIAVFFFNAQSAWRPDSPPTYYRGVLVGIAWSSDAIWALGAPHFPLLFLRICEACGTGTLTAPNGRSNIDKRVHRPGSFHQHAKCPVFNRTRSALPIESYIFLSVVDLLTRSGIKCISGGNFD